MRNIPAKHLGKCIAVLVLFWLLMIPVSQAFAAELLLPSGMKEIGEQAFYGDTNLDAVTVPEGTEVIESKAFAMSSVKTVTLPGSLREVADDAFLGCSDLTVNAQKGTYAYTWAVRNGYIKTQGTEEATTVLVSETLQAGSDLTVEVIGPANTIHHSIYIVDEQTGIYQHNELETARGTATFSGYNFDSGSTYRLTVYTVTSQFQTLTPAVEIIKVTGQKPAAPVYSIPEQLIIGQSYDFDSEGYFSVCTKREYYSSDGSFIKSTSGWGQIPTYLFRDSGIEGIIKVSYSVYKNDLWSEWSDQYTISVVNPSYLVGDIDFPDTVENGTDIEISFEYENNPQSYSYSVFSRETTEEVLYYYSPCDYDASTVSLQLPTRELDQGQYTFELCFNSNDGISTIVCQKSFLVSGERAPAPLVTCENTDIWKGTYVYFSITTPETEAVSYILNHGGWQTERNTFASDGELTYWSDYCYEAGIWKYQFAVMREGKWSALSEPIEIIVKEKEKLRAPTVHITTPIQAGQDLTVSFDEVENAEHYYVTIASQYDSGDYLYSIDPATPADLQEIPGYILNSGSYNVSVSAYADGYDTSTQEKRVVVSGTRPAGPAVTVEEPIHSGGTNVFSIDTTNAEALTVKYSIDFSDGAYESVSITGDTSTWQYWIDEIWRGAPLSVSFSVKVNGIWSTWTTNTYTIEEPLPATPTSLDPITPTTLDSVTINMDDTVEAGRDFSFSIELDSIDDTIYYEYSLIDSEGHGLSGNVIDTSLTTVNINGYDIEPGEYAIRVLAYSEVNNTESTIEKPFSIVGTKPGAPHVQIDKTHVFKKEVFTFVIETMNTDMLYCYESYPFNSEISWHKINVFEDETLWSNSTADLGIHEYSFTAKKNGVWSAWSEPIVINVTDYDSLESPEITVLSELGSGKDLLISLSEVEGAKQYRLDVQKKDGSIELSSVVALQDAEAHSLPGYRLTSGEYIITARSEFYINGQYILSESTQITIEIPKTDRPAAPSITPPTNISSGEYIIFSISTVDADMVARRTFPIGNTNNISFSSIAVDDGEDETTWQLYFDGTPRKYSFAVYKDGIWSEWSSFYAVALSE